SIIIRRVGTRSAEDRRRLGSIPGPNKLSESLIYFTSVQGTKHPSMKRPFPGFLEGRAASPNFGWSGGPEFEKLASDLSGIRNTFYRFELLWELLRQASLHNEAVQDSWTALYCGLGCRIRARPPGKAGSREGWMFMVRIGNWPTKYVVTSRMNPAKTTRSVRFSFRTFTTSRSKAARSFPKGRWSITTAGTSAFFARARTGAPGTLHTRTTRSAARSPRSRASTRLWKSVPLPDASTPTRRRAIGSPQCLNSRVPVKTMAIPN